MWTSILTVNPKCLYAEPAAWTQGAWTQVALWEARQLTTTPMNDVSWWMLASRLWFSPLSVTCIEVWGRLLTPFNLCLPRRDGYLVAWKSVNLNDLNLPLQLITESVTWTVCIFAWYTHWTLHRKMRSLKYVILTPKRWLWFKQYFIMLAKTHARLQCCLSVSVQNHNVPQTNWGHYGLCSQTEHSDQQWMYPREFILCRSVYPQLFILCRS